jgi:hypothetical protein
MTPTTKLEAVNIMLSSIGESPVNSLTSGLVDAEMAETILEATSRDVQSMGWHFNTEPKFRITPLVSGEIQLPSNCLKADATAGSETARQFDLTQRGQRLYDRTTHSFSINATVEVDLVLMLEFEEMPEAARRFVTLRAARVFQDRAVGSSELHGFQERDELRAMVELKDMEADTADHNIFDNYSVARVLDRAITHRIS